MNSLHLPNGHRHQPAPKKERKPEDFIMDANLKASHRTNIVAQVGERLFQACWKDMSRWARRDPEHVERTMRMCIDVADAWRKEINEYQDGQAEAIHNEAAERARAAGLVLPTWGEIKDSVPFAHTLFKQEGA